MAPKLMAPPLAHRVATLEADRAAKGAARDRLQAQVAQLLTAKVIDHDLIDRLEQRDLRRLERELGQLDAELAEARARHAEALVADDVAARGAMLDEIPTLGIRLGETEKDLAVTLNRLGGLLAQRRQLRERGFELARLAERWDQADLEAGRPVQAYSVRAGERLPSVLASTFNDEDIALTNLEGQPVWPPR